MIRMIKKSYNMDLIIMDTTWQKITCVGIIILRDGPGGRDPRLYVKHVHNITYF